MRTCTSVLLALSSLTSAAHAQDLLVVESSDKVVMLVSGVDGSLLDKSYIDLKTSTGTAPIWPSKAIEVGDEIWINDAHTNKLIYVFDRSGNYLREFHGGERPYGMAFAYGRVWVSNPTIPVSGRDLREFDTAGNLLNVYPIGTETHCFDLIPWNGALLLSDKSGNELDLWDTSGNYLGKFHEGGGPGQIEYPIQIANRASNGNLLVASDTFSPGGIFEYDASGTQVNHYDTTPQTSWPVLGVHELQNGNLLYTDWYGIRVWDISTGLVTTVMDDIDPGLISELSASGPDPATYCDPTDGSTNNTATITASSSSLSSGVTIDLAGGPPNQFCYLLIGDGNGILHQPPGSAGDLCVVGGGCLGRYAGDIGPISAASTYSTDLESSASGGANYGIPTCGGNISAGETWYFQYWHRRPQGQPSTFSQALGVTFAN